MISTVLGWTEVIEDNGSEHRPVAFLVPGIGFSYISEAELLSGNFLFSERCHLASIQHLYPATLEDSLENQKLAYVINCTICDIFRAKAILPDVTVGYSMGIYAALYAGGYYSFETGLQILTRAFQLVRDVCLSTHDTYAMAVILGLSESDIRKHVLNSSRESEIAVFNGPRNFVIAGLQSLVEEGLNRATKLGAFGTIRIQTKYPYHTRYLKEISNDFHAFLESMKFLDPSAKTLSPINGEVIHRENIKSIIVSAMFSALHFDEAIFRLKRSFGIRRCYETGPSQSMKKLVRYIEKGFEVFSLGKDITI